LGFRIKPALQLVYDNRMLFLVNKDRPLVPPPAIHVPAAIDQNRIEPRLKVPARVIPVQVLEGPKKGFLGGIPGIIAVPQKTPCCAQDPLLIERDQLLECWLIPHAGTLGPEQPLL